MSKTSIEWTDFSVNPIRARDVQTGAVGHFCEKVSPGCANCYSSRMQRRFRMHEFVVKNRHKVEFFLDESKLQEVLRRRQPTKFFWEDMSDLFGDWVQEEWLDKCFAVMALTPAHTHQVLTKRPERMRDYIVNAESRITKLLESELGTFPDGIIWPLHCVWLGVSVEDQKAADERIPLLLQTPAAVRFISAEPLLGPVDLKYNFGYWICPECGGVRDWDNHDPFTYRRRDKRGPEDQALCLSCDYAGKMPFTRQLHWVIVGGESGPVARPMHPDWARGLRDQCQAAGVPFFFKQWGEFCPHVINETGTRIENLAWAMTLRSIKLHKFDDGEVVARLGKKTAGALLDGQEYKEFPVVRRV